MNDRTSSISPPNLATTKSAQLLVVFNLDGMEPGAINADTAEQQTELERRLSLIQPGLDAVKAIILRKSIRLQDSQHLRDTTVTIVDFNVSN